MLVFCVWEVPGYESGPETGYPEGFLGFCQSFRKKAEIIWPTPNKGTATSYRKLCNSYLLGFLSFDVVDLRPWWLH